MTPFFRNCSMVGSFQSKRITVTIWLLLQQEKSGPKYEDLFKKDSKSPFPFFPYLDAGVGNVTFFLQEP